MVLPLISISLELLPEFIPTKETLKVTMRILVSFLFFFVVMSSRLFIIIQSCYDHDRGIFGINQFQESVIMRHQFLAARTEIEVLTN